MAISNKNTQIITSPHPLQDLERYVPFTGMAGERKSSTKILQTWQILDTKHNPSSKR